MGRPRKLETHADGSATIRIQFGARLCKIAARHAAKYSLNVSQSLEMLMAHLDAMLTHNLINWLPMEWQQMNKEQRNEESGLPPNLVNVDLSKLHRSNKTKSGFVGVYANARGFRAMHGNNYIGQFDTAEEAAWHRYCYMKKNRLAYGELAEVIENYRQNLASAADETDDELMIQAIETSVWDGTTRRLAELLPDHLKTHPRVVSVFREVGYSPGQTADPAPKAAPGLPPGYDFEAMLQKQRARDELEERRERLEAKLSRLAKGEAGPEDLD